MLAYWWGALTYKQASDSYELSQKVVETGATSTQTVKCQNGKKYRVPYAVYEKAFSNPKVPCNTSGMAGCGC